MSTWKIAVRIAAFAGLLLLSSVRAEASGCCDKDCTDAYGTMLASGVPAGDAAEWYRGCLQACKEHGDPSTCPIQDAMAAGDGADAETATEAVVRDVAPGRGLEPDVIGGRAFIPIPR